MSTIRSLITGMFPIGSTVITPLPLPPALRRAGEVGVAGQPRLVVDPHPARPADRLQTGAADPDRAIALVALLEDRVQHRPMTVQLDSELIPICLVPRLRVVPTQAQGVLRHSLWQVWSLWLGDLVEPVAESLTLPATTACRASRSLTLSCLVRRSCTTARPPVVWRGSGGSSQA